MTDPALGGPVDSTAVRIAAIEIMLDRVGMVGPENGRWLLAELRAARAEIARLSTPDIAGYDDEIGYAEDDFDSLRTYLRPNRNPRTVWCNRSLGESIAVRLVVSWTEDGDMDEDEIRFYPTEQEAHAAIAASNALRPALSSQETPDNG